MMWANFVLEEVKWPNSCVCHVTRVADNDRCNLSCITKGDKSALIRYIYARMSGPRAKPYSRGRFTVR